MIKYFKEVSFIKILVLNLIMGLILSGPAFIGFILIVGLITPAAVEEQILGIAIIIGVLLILFFGNYILWKRSKKENKEKKENTKKHIKIKIIIVIIILILLLSSFSILGLNSIWLFINGFWF